MVARDGMISMMGVKTYSTYLAVYKLEFGDASVIPDEEAQARDVFAALEKKWYLNCALIQFHWTSAAPMA